jgi:hypothetical protein
MLVRGESRPEDRRLNYAQVNASANNVSTPPSQQLVHSMRPMDQNIRVSPSHIDNNFTSKDNGLVCDDPLTVQQKWVQNWISKNNIL